MSRVVVFPYPWQPLMSPVPPTPAPFVRRAKPTTRVHISSPIEVAPYERTHNSKGNAHTRRKGTRSRNSQRQDSPRFNQSSSSRSSQDASSTRLRSHEREHTGRANTSGESRGSSLSPHQRSFPSFSSRYATSRGEIATAFILLDPPAARLN